MFGVLFPYYPLFPRIPHVFNVPPTLYTILESIVNYDREPDIPVKDLAKYGRHEIFNFDYDLTENVSRETFECNILNHFLMRRINSETVTLFNVRLQDKLNEILPKYNMLFDSIKNWDLFRDGQTILETFKGKDDTLTGRTNETNIGTDYNEKRRHSDLPQSRLQDVDNESYINIYENNNSNTTNKTTSNGNEDRKNQNEYVKEIKYSQADLLRLYKEFSASVQNVYTLLYQDLEPLFFGIMDY